MSGRPTAVEVLLAAGADVNAVGNDGTSALMEASHHGFLKVVRVLVFAGADINARDRNGSTALTLACGDGHLDVVQALLAKGADVNAHARPGGRSLQGTAMMIALHREHAAVVRVLLAAPGIEVAEAQRGRILKVLHEADEALLAKAMGTAAA